MRDFTINLTEGAEVWSYNGRVHYRYNAKLKVSGDSVKVAFYQKGITAGFSKNRLEGEKKERARAEYDEKERFEKTGRTARKRIYDFVASNLHKHKDHNGKKQSFKFVTLTFRNDVTSLDVANRLFKTFMQRLNAHFADAQFLEYVAVPELQKETGRNVWHFHVLFFNLPFLPVSGDMVDKLVAKGALLPDYDKRNTLFYIWSNGSVDMCKVDFRDSYDIAGYISKYVGKGLEGDYTYAEGARTLNKKRFLRSKGLFGPKLLIAFLTKAQRQRILDYFKGHAKHFKRKGEIGSYFDTWSVDCEYVGKIFGIDFRAAQTHIAKLEDVFSRYSYGFAV